MSKYMDDWKKISSEELEVQRLLDREKLYRDEVSLSSGFQRGYQEGKLKALVQSFNGMRSKGFENEQIRDLLEVNDSDYKEVLKILDN